MSEVTLLAAAAAAAAAASVGDNCNAVVDDAVANVLDGSVGGREDNNKRLLLAMFGFVVVDDVDVGFLLPPPIDKECDRGRIITNACVVVIVVGQPHNSSKATVVVSTRSTCRSRQDDNGSDDDTFRLVVVVDIILDTTMK